MKKALTISATLAALLLIGGLAWAQSPSEAPNPDDYDAEAAAAVSAGLPSTPTAPTGQFAPDVGQMAVPGIPAVARQRIADSDFVEIYCLMTKWKSGQFLAALDALEKHLLPAVSQAQQITGSLKAPDITTMRSTALAKIQTVCGASTVEAADAALKDLVGYGQSTEAQFESLRDEMNSKLQAAGDALRRRIEDGVQPLVRQKKADAEAELQSLGDTLGKNAEAKIRAEVTAKTFASPEQGQSFAEGLIASESQSIKTQIQGRGDQLKKQIETDVRTEVDRIAGAEIKQFEDLGGVLQKLNPNINADISAGQTAYQTYRDQSYVKRKAVALDLVDQAIAKAKTELEASRQRIEEARQDNPGMLGVDDILAELNSDRTALSGQLDAALKADDEAAFEAAVNAFQTKWEGYRADMEKAFFSVKAICDKAAGQFSGAKSQLADGAKRLEELHDRCATSTSQDCLKINELGPRFAALTSKMNGISSSIGAVETACADQASTDPQSLVNMLTKMKSDSQDLETYGQALEAEKSKLVAESLAAACAQALPKIKAARTEMQNDDLTGLEANVNRCQGQTGEDCTVINGLAAEVTALKTQMTAYLADLTRMETLCSSAQDDSDFLEARDLGDYLQSRGQEISKAAKELREKQSAQASQKVVCQAASGGLEIAKREISQGLAESSSAVSGCQGQTDPRCAAINAVAGKVSEVTSRSAAALQKIDSILTACRNAGDQPASQSLLDDLAAVRQDGQAVKKLVAELKDQGDSKWPDRIKTGKPFKVVLDKAPDLFDDKPWSGDWRTDQMGTIQGGQTYSVSYSPGRWAATGYNEGTGRSGTWTYRYGDPDKFELDIWGRVYFFDPSGNVYDRDFGLVGHLAE